MMIRFQHEQLYRLMASLHILTDIRANILDVRGKDMYPKLDHAPFCARMTGCAAGLERCRACDERAARECAGQSGFRFYRCHAGVCEAILPIRADSASPPVAYVVFGQFLDDSPVEEQWERAKPGLGWWSGGAEDLREDFFRFRRYSGGEMRAFADVLETLAAYILQKEMLSLGERTDLQRLELFLDQHYMEKLSLASISAALHIGRTKLCALAKELSGGETLSCLIVRRRIEAAKDLLLRSDRSVSAVAEAVGISDYNYFSKVFRAATGYTPSAFRKMGRQNAERPD